jgi:hypothetical protein
MISKLLGDDWGTLEFMASFMKDEKQEQSIHYFEEVKQTIDSTTLDEDTSYTTNFDEIDYQQPPHLK